MKAVFPSREDYADLRRDMRDEMATQLGEMREEMNTRFDLVPTREEMLEQGDEWLRRYDVTAEQLRSEIQAVAEGIENVFQAVDRLREERDASRAEELDVLRAGHRDLDRRLRRVEQKVDGEPPAEHRPER